MQQGAIKNKLLHRLKLNRYLVHLHTYLIPIMSKSDDNNTRLLLKDSTQTLPSVLFCLALAFCTYVALLYHQQVNKSSTHKKDVARSPRAAHSPKGLPDLQRSLCADEAEGSSSMLQQPNRGPSLAHKTITSSISRVIHGKMGSPMLESGPSSELQHAEHAPLAQK
jgi:hypothetical protein